MKALDAAASGLHWNDILVMLYEVLFWLHCGYAVAAAMAAALARGEALWWLPGQPGEHKCICSSNGSLRLLPAS